MKIGIIGVTGSVGGYISGILLETLPKITNEYQIIGIGRPNSKNNLKIIKNGLNLTSTLYDNELKYKINSKKFKIHDTISRKNLNDCNIIIISVDNNNTKLVANSLKKSINKNTNHLIISKME